nr:sialate O-acetylesterase [Bacillota bacterium]
MFEIAKIFTDRMILQRNKPIRIFGDGDEDVTVTFDNQSANAEVKGGKWLAELPPHTEGGPFELRISTAKKTVILKDILVGDVWLAAGQSNMEMPLMFDLRGVEEGKNCYNDKIRFYTCSRETHQAKTTPSWAFGWTNNEQSPWQVCDEESALCFSAIGYYVAKFLSKETNIPIGVISANRGCTKIDSFVPEKAFETEEFKDYLDWFNSNKVSDGEADGFYDRILKENTENMKGYEKAAEEFAKAMTPEAAAVKTEVAIPRSKVELPLCKYSVKAPSVFYRVFIKEQLAPISICGVLWYQGESSRFDINYADKFKLMAGYWREAFRDSDIPFYTVEIAAHCYPDGIVPARFRMEQWRAARITEKTYITSTRDLGDYVNIHPHRKMEVAKQLSNQILNYTYGI